MNILKLPTELQHEILKHLDWDDHFIASLVCPRWGTILQDETFRRKRYLYDRIDPEAPDHRGYIKFWGLRRYLPNDPGPPWRSKVREGGYLSLHGLLWTERLIISIRKDTAGAVTSRLLLAADAKGYQKVPAGGISVLKHAHDGRWGVHNYFDITESPLLKSDTIYFWGGEALSESDVEGLAKLSLADTDSESDIEVLPPMLPFMVKKFNIPERLRKLPNGLPVVRFRNPVRVRTLSSGKTPNKKAEKKKEEAHDRSPSNYKNQDKNVSVPAGMFDASIYSAPVSKKYVGSNGDAIGNIINITGEYLKEQLLKNPSTMECWAVFDSVPRYQYEEPRFLFGYRDPRKDIVLDVTVLRSEPQKRKKRSFFSKSPSVRMI
ncbi:hypothetical protein TWF694_002654 [Orbilia ellipsospora]|uniref:F-box domain-containing protein n=1 Tax=Orbilia ellipsospora TaxID=2528407 RepID=A0AAV9X2K8_9PEZI